MRWLLALLALVLPPLVLVRARGLWPTGAVLLWLVALALFVLVSWGVGLILAVAAGLLAFALVLRAGDRP
jgi:hypothetical protein